MGDNLPQIYAELKYISFEPTAKNLVKTRNERSIKMQISNMV